MTAPVDRIAPDWLVNGLTIGDAMARLEKQIRVAIEWRVLHSNAAVQDPELHEALNTWYRQTFGELEAVFTHKANALRFRVADAVSPLAPERARYLAIHASCSRVLADTYEAFLSERATIARALESLQEQIARHQEAVELIRQSSSYSEAVWKKLFIEPEFAGPITKLLNNGVAQNAIWDLLKFVFTVAVIAPPS